MESKAHGDDEGRLTRSQVLGFLLLFMTMVGLYLCSCFALPFVPALVLALSLRVVSRPLYDALTRRTTSTSMAAGLTVALVAGTLVLPLVWVGQTLATQVTASVHDLASPASAQRWTALVTRNPWLSSSARWLPGVNLHSEVGRLAQEGARWIPTIVGASVMAAGQVLIAIFVLFYFLRDHAQILDSIRSMLPLTEPEVDQIYGRVTATVWATVVGVVAMAALKGLLGGLAFWVLGVPAPLLWGTVMGIVSLVPVLGPFIVWIPAAAFLMLEGSYGRGTFLIAYGLVVLSLVDDVLYPRLVGEQLQMHILLVLFSMLGGLVVIGSAGVVAGPVVVSMTTTLLEIWRRRTEGGRAAEGALEGAGLPEHGRSSARLLRGICPAGGLDLAGKFDPAGDLIEVSETGR